MVGEEGVVGERDKRRKRGRGGKKEGDSRKGISTLS